MDNKLLSPTQLSSYLKPTTLTPGPLLSPIQLSTYASKANPANPTSDVGSSWDSFDQAMKTPTVKPSGLINDLKPEVTAGIDTITKGGEQIAKGAEEGGIGGVMKASEGVLSGAAGALRTALSPMTLAFNALTGNKFSDAMSAIQKDLESGQNKGLLGTLVNKLSDSPSFQKFATDNPDAAEVFNNLVTVGSAFVGGKEAPGVASTLKDTAGAIKDATGTVVDTAKKMLPETKTPPLSETQISEKTPMSPTALKAHDIIDKEIRNTAEKYPTVGEALNKAEVAKGTEPIKVISSYPNGKALPTMTKGGKMNSIPAINFLKDQVSRLGEIKGNLVDTVKESVPVEDFKQAAFDRIDKGNGSLTKKIADKTDVGKIIDGMKDTYPDGIPITELDKIKTEQANESKSYRSKSPFSADSHAVVGQTAADAVVSKGGNAPIDELNKLLSSHYDAIKVLASMNGKTPHGGIFSRHMSGIAGEVAGLAGGMAVGHPFIGAMVGRGTSEFVNNVLSSHFISNPLKAMLIKNMKGLEPSVVQKALDYIDASGKNNPGLTPTEPTTVTSQVKTKTTSVKSTTKPSNSKTTNLIKEAQKYKTAEEFVKGQQPSTKIISTNTKQIAIKDLYAHGEPELNDAINNVKNGSLSRTNGAIDVTQRPTGEIIVLDGQHRVVQAMNSGEKNIKVNVIPYEEAISPESDHYTIRNLIENGDPVPFQTKSQLTDIWNKAHTK